MKQKRGNYRKVWIDNYGEIPRDVLGRSYEIHHLDGNRGGPTLLKI